MELPANRILVVRLLRWSRYLVAGVILIAFLALAGWQFDVRILLHPLPGLVAMNPVTAISFIILSLSFLLLHINAGGHSKNTRSAAVILSSLVLLIALIKLMAIAGGPDWGIDTLFYKTKLQEDLTGTVPNSMAPNTAFCFLLISISLLLFNKEATVKRVPAQYMAVIVALFGWFSVLGYIYEVKTFYGVLKYIPMAFHSAICFLLLSFAILFAQPGKGIMKEFTSSLSGSFSARLLVPAAIIFPTLLGLLRLYGHKAGIYSSEFGTALYALAFIAVFLFLAWYIAYTLNKRDAQKKETEDALRNSEQEIAAIFRAAPDAVIVIDSKSRIVKWNKEAEALFGWTGNEVIGRSLTDTIVPPEYREAHKRGVQHFLHSGESRIIGQTVEVVAMKKNGEIFDIALRLAHIHLKDCDLFVGFVRDITEHKKTAQKLKNFNEELQLQVKEKTKEVTDLLERVTDAFIALDKNFCYTYLNKKAGELIHREPATMIGKYVWAEFPDAVGSATYHAFNRAMAEQQYIINTDHYAPLELWHENHIYPSLNGLSVFIRDISKRKKAEKEVTEAKQLADKLIDSLPGVFYFYDETGKFIRWNKQFEEVTGYSAEEIAGMHPAGFFDDTEKEYITGKIRTVFEKGVSDAQANLMTKTGDNISYYFKAVLIHYEGRPCLLGNGIDITEQKKAETLLKESEQKYKLLFFSNPLPMWMLSLPDYQPIEVNDAALQQYGYTREEFLRLSVFQLRPEEDIERFKAAIDTSFRGIHRPGTWRHKRKDGSLLYVDITTHDMYYNNAPVRLVLANDITESYLSAEKLKESYEAIRKLTDHLQQVREEERTRIAREIHDELGQQLTVLKMDIAWINKKTDPADSQMKERTTELLSMVDTTVKTVRRIAAELRPSLLDDLGLIPAMEWYIEEFGKRSGIKTAFNLQGTETGLADEARIGLYRILQESLTNVARHANATGVNIEFVQTDKKVILTIADNGIGFDIEKISKKTLGLLGMKERALMLGGEYSINGSTGKGTTITVTVPVAKTES
ncbi:MAG: PAS domain S-box protein [Chitinophagaceae bacterium]|nr:PAS domain S-box protein [Chitinophagaceae bacterium]